MLPALNSCIDGARRRFGSGILDSHWWLSQLGVANDELEMSIRNGMQELDQQRLQISQIEKGGLHVNSAASSFQPPGWWANYFMLLLRLEPDSAFPSEMEEEGTCSFVDTLISSRAK